jgi:cytochrome oxidase assembly protein ShyY1
MKMRWPLIPTIIVAIAVMTMIALGIWQLQRKGEKEALIALYAANRQKPAIIYPALGPVPDTALFRKSSANCLEVTNWQSGAGKDDKGRSGIRYIAQCKTSGAEGPGLVVLAGVADRPDLKPVWKGGIVSGTIVTEPDKRNLLQKAFGGKQVLRPMLIAAKPVAGLRTPAQPSPDDVTNNHLAYAVQWFLFAVAALVIYVLALRRRQTGQ